MPRSANHVGSSWQRPARLGLAVLGLTVAGLVRAVETAAPPVLDLGSRRELFVDQTLIERLDHATLRLHEPAHAGVVLKIDRPWEGPANFGGVVIHLQGRYLLYYRGMTLDKDDDLGRVCVAVSNDGETWTKPALVRDERSGRTDANIVINDSGYLFGGTVWLDTRPGVPDGERVKAVKSMPVSGETHTAYKDPKGPKRIDLWASGDGLVFHRIPADRQPTLVSDLPNSFDGGNTMFWSEEEQCYVFYFRIMTADRMRTMARTTSKDLRTWTTPVSMTYGEAPPEQFYVNNTGPYYRAPQLYIGLAARFMQGRSAVTDEQAKAVGLKSPRGIIYNKDCSDGVMLTTRAGSTQYDRTFLEALGRPGPGAGNWVSRTNYPMTGIFPLGKDQIMFFVNRNYLQDAWHIERMVLRVDGFASVNAPHSGGSLLTKPLRISGEELQMNYATSAAGSVRVEIQDLDGSPLPGFALADSPEHIGDEIDGVVRWKNGATLGALAGRAVRLHFVMRDADLYSLRFASGRNPSAQ